jgi:hypothetical protein
MAKETENKELNISEVEKAITYIHSNRDFGFFIVTIEKNSNKPVGSMLITFALNIQSNIKTWWI